MDNLDLAIVVVLILALVFILWSWYSYESNRPHQGVKLSKAEAAENRTFWEENYACAYDWALAVGAGAAVAGSYRAYFGSKSAAEPSGDLQIVSPDAEPVGVDVG